MDESTGIEQESRRDSEGSIERDNNFNKNSLNFSCVPSRDSGSLVQSCVQMLFCPASRTSSGLRGSLCGRMLEECVYGKEAEEIVTAHRLVGSGVSGTRGGSLVRDAG